MRNQVVPKAETVRRKLNRPSARHRIAVQRAEVIVYRGSDEVIVTTTELENEMLQRCFSERCGRDRDEYERLVAGTEAIVTLPHAVRVTRA